MGPSEDVLRGLLAAAPDALLAVDASGLIVFVNDQAELLFGWPASELLGQPVEVLIPSRFGDRHPALRSGYVSHPAARPMGAGLELWARRKDGTEFPAEISLSGFDTPDGTLVAAAIRDVTMARRNEQRFRAVLASAPDAIVGVDAAGRIELLNGQAERLFGWTVDELRGKQVELLVPEEFLGRHEQHRARFVADPSARPMGAGLQLSARRKDGSSFPAEISLSAVIEADTGILTLAAVRDVTDRVELEAARRRQELEAGREQSHRLESVGQLAGGIAHDFNNLLGVILNYCILLRRRVTDDVAVADLGEIQGAAERAANLTRQLLAFARREVANPEAVDVNEIATGFASLLGRTLGEHVELRLQLTADPVVVLVDRHQIEQVLLNLALNARDAMPGGGLLTIATGTTTDPVGRFGEHGPVNHLQVDVIDTGEGMEPSVLERAFEPFFTTKALGEGTGLGLATVYGIVRQNGGEVEIHSARGRGTTVSVHLPLVDVDPARRPLTGRQASGGTERILVVEDEPALRLATSRILSDHGYTVIPAQDGVDALEVLTAATEPIDVVVTDVAMPRMRGDALAAELRARWPGLPVIFVTGYDSGGTSLDGRLLEKPVGESDLLQAVRGALDEQR